MSESFIQLSDVEKTYHTGSVAVPVLKGVSLEIVAGERVALLGRSGSGKSTLLNLLAGLDHSTGGTIEVGAARVDRFGPREMAEYRLSTVGMVFQACHLLAMKSAVENVEMPLVLAGRPRGERRRQATEALAAVGLGDRIDHRPTGLSGGEQQRVAVARALVNRPSVLLADQPTGNLDSETATEVVDVIDRLTREYSITVLLVTHDNQLAGNFADRVMRMRDGHLVSDNR